MAHLDRSAGVYTNCYELSTTQAYLKNKRKEATDTFEYFFRKNLFQGYWLFLPGSVYIIGISASLREVRDKLISGKNHKPKHQQDEQKQQRNLCQLPDTG